MYDSSVKVPTAIEYGVLYQFGNFDQCMDIETDFNIVGLNIKPKYCLADVQIENYVLRHSATRSRTNSRDILQVNLKHVNERSMKSESVEFYKKKSI